MRIPQKLTVVAALLAPLFHVQAQTLLSDFSSSAGWGTSTTLVGTGATIGISGGTAGYTSTSHLGPDFVIRQYTGAVGSFDSNWSVQINVNYAAPSSIFTPAIDQFLNMGLMVVNTAVTPGVSSNLPNFHGFAIESNVYLNANNGLRDIRTGVFAPGSFTDDTIRYPSGTTASVPATTFTSAAVRISYDAGTNVLTGAYDATGGTSFTSIPTLTVNAATAWGMTSGDTFSIYLLANSGEDADGSDPGPAVGAGEAVFDNLYGANLTAVPEPSTYAAIFGAAALGLAAWRRKQRKANVA